MQTHSQTTVSIVQTTLYQSGFLLRLHLKYGRRWGGPEEKKEAAIQARSCRGTRWGRIGAETKEVQERKAYVCELEHAS